MSITPFGIYGHYQGTAAEEEMLAYLPPELRQNIIRIIKESQKKEINALIKKTRIRRMGMIKTIPQTLLRIDPGYQYISPPKHIPLAITSIEDHWGVRNIYGIERYEYTKHAWYIEEYCRTKYGDTLSWLC